MRKRASVDWTVGKLLNIVLAMIVLALVVYGVSTQSLNPLWDNIEGKFDEVKILSPWSDDVASGECHKENVLDKDFLKAINMEGKEVVLYVCKNRICNISGEGLGTYRTDKGNFEKLENGKWKDYNSLIVEGINSAEFNWELYNEGVSVLGDVKNLYNEGFTKKFVLYGDGSGINREIYAIWQNGYWRVTERGQIPDGVGWIKDGDKWSFDTNKGGWGSTIKITNLYNGTNDNKAIDAFVEKVKGGDDDKVYWSELEFDEIYNKDVDVGQEIGTFVDNEGMWSSFDELDDDKKVKKLKEEFAKMKEEYLSEARVSVKDFGKGIVGEEVTIKDKRFIVGIEDDSEFPIITFSSNGEKSGFKHGVYANVNSDFIKGIKLRDFPLSLVKWDGSEWKDAGNEEYYRLPKENFDEVYKATLISRLLKERCR